MTLTFMDTHNDRGLPRSRAELLRLAASELERAERAERMANDPTRTPGGRRMGELALQRFLDRAEAFEAAALSALR